jgi:hypothetical protein
MALILPSEGGADRQFGARRFVAVLYPLLVLAGVVFIIVGVAAVVGFVVATARNSERYAESLQPPDDLRRADESSNPTGGSPNGGTIWPDNR